MLSEILSREDCAACRMCCFFDRYDIWEMPVFSPEAAERVMEFAPETVFAAAPGGFVLDIGAMTGEDILPCPALTDTGCMLGELEPFDCALWPFRIMKSGESRVIGVSRLCDKVYAMSAEELKDYLKRGLARKLFDYADSHPEAAKRPCDNYTILLNESEVL